jgi:hypothetical protein
MEAYAMDHMIRKYRLLISIKVCHSNFRQGVDMIEEIFIHFSNRLELWLQPPLRLHNPPTYRDRYVYHVTKIQADMLCTLISGKRFSAAWANQWMTRAEAREYDRAALVARKTWEYYTEQTKADTNTPWAEDESQRLDSFEFWQGAIEHARRCVLPGSDVHNEDWVAKFAASLAEGRCLRISKLERTFYVTRPTGFERFLRLEDPVLGRYVATRAEADQLAFDVHGCTFVEVIRLPQGRLKDNLTTYCVYASALLCWIECFSPDLTDLSSHRHSFQRLHNDAMAYFPRCSPGPFSSEHISVEQVPLGLSQSLARAFGAY